MTEAAAILTIAEAAERLRVSIRTLEREARDGRLAIVRIRSIRLVALTELERYIAAQSGVTRPSIGPSTCGGPSAVSIVERVLGARVRPVLPETKRRRSKLRLVARVR